MKRVRVIKPYTAIVTVGDEVLVDDESAARLIELGRVELVEDNPPIEGNVADTTTDPIENPVADDETPIVGLDEEELPDPVPVRRKR